jgi:hypothetical protein
MKNKTMLQQMKDEAKQCASTMNSKQLLNVLRTLIAKKEHEYKNTPEELNRLNIKVEIAALKKCVETQKELNGLGGSKEVIRLANAGAREELKKEPLFAQSEG